MVAQSNVPIDDEGHFLQPDRIKAREGADFPVVTAQEVTLMDVAPNQIASIAASLIPSWSTTMRTVPSWDRT